MPTVEAGYSLEQHIEGVPRRLDAPMLRLDFAKELADLQTSHAWLVTGHSAKTLVKYSDLRVVLLAFKRGASMGQHPGIGRLSLQTIEGRVRVKLPGEDVDLPAGAMLALGASVLHDIEAIEQSTVLLTMAWPVAGEPDLEV